MGFQVALSQTLDKTPACLDGLSELIDPSWIHQALAANLDVPDQSIKVFDRACFF